MTYYFAYGSNMSLEQMKIRCPSCKMIAIGELRDYLLEFPRWSKSRKCGVSSIIYKKDSNVWGVIFELIGDDVTKLDRKEGYRNTRPADKNSYNKIDVAVSSAGNTIKCMTYIANPEDGEYRPSRSYMNDILTGARENELPEEYIHWLSRIPLQKE